MKVFLRLSLLLILVSLIVHTRHIADAGLTTADDIRAELKTREILRDGWKVYWQDAARLAAGEGRFYYYASLGLFFLPYVFPDGLLRAAVILAVQFASLVALALYLRRYLSSRTFWFLLALLCALLPLWNNFHPVTTDPVFYHAPVLLFFSSMLLRARTLRSRPLLRWSYLAPLFASLWFYEALVLPFLLIAIVEELSEQPLPDGRGSETIAPSRVVPSRDRQGAVLTSWSRRPIGSILPVLLVFGLWTVLFAGYRQIHNGNYDGSAFAPFSLTATLRGIAAFSGEGIPGMNLLLQAVLIPEVARGYLPSLGIPAILLAHLSPIGWAQALLALALGVLYSWTGERKPTEPSALAIGWRRPALPVLLCVVIAILLPLPLTISAKYRDTAAAWAPYVPGYYAFLAWMAGFALTLEPLLRLSQRLRPRNQRLTRLAAAAILGAGCFVLVGGTAIANDAVGAAQARLALKWKVVDALLKTSALDRLAPGSVVFAPALWEGLTPVDWMPYEDYWTQYIALHSGRRLVVARTDDAAGLLKNPLAAAYYATPVAGGCSGDGLLVTRIVRDADADTRLLSNEAILVSKNGPDGCDLQAILAGKPGDLLTDGDPHTYLRLPRAGVQHGVYVDAFKTPLVLAASATLVPNAIARWPGVPTVAMEFVKGFSTREWTGDKFWVWSNGASGEGELNFRNNAGQALAARFHSTVITGDPAKARFDMESADRHASEMVANGESCDWVLHLQPGDNRVRLKSFAQRMEAPGDARYIVFGLQNWSLIRDDEAPVR